MVAYYCPICNHIIVRVTHLRYRHRRHIHPSGQWHQVVCMGYYHPEFKFDEIVSDVRQKIKGEHL